MLLIWFVFGLVGTLLLDVLQIRPVLKSAVTAFGFARIPAGPDLFEKKDELWTAAAELTNTKTTVLK